MNQQFKIRKQQDDLLIEFEILTGKLGLHVDYFFKPPSRYRLHGIHFPLPRFKYARLRQCLTAQEAPIWSRLSVDIVATNSVTVFKGTLKGNWSSIFSSVF